MVATNTYNGTDYSNLGNVNNSVSYRYADKTNYLSGITHTSSVLGTSKLDFTYGNLANGQMPDQIYSVKWNGVSKKNYIYDGLGRITGQTVYPSIGVSLQNTYTYKDVGENNTSTQVSRLTNALGTYDYEYDVNGNITKITFTAPTGSTGSYVREYQYDHLNRVTSTYDSRYSYRHEYEYDANGNIISRNRYYGDETEPDREYRYDYNDTVWGDLLTAFCGDEITYDEIGNPLDYYNDTVFTWQNGRQLASITKGGKTTTYTYNADGQRISKTVDGVTTEFIYAGDILAGQKTGDNILMWIYDNNGSYIGFTYNGVEYYYVYNLQGDVVAITDSTGTIVAKYEYDTWGEVQYEANYNETVNIAVINPIRYRGYYYDSERGLYYLNSRYYDPFMCRFLNADTLIDNRGIITQNLFQYCGNNPVNNADLSGNLFGAIVGIGLVVIGMVATLSGCSSKPATTTSTPSTPSKPSTPSSSTSSTTTPHIPTLQEKSYAATVYAEAGGQNKRSKQAVAHVMNNRIGTRSSWTDIESVISAKYQFDGYNSPMYQAAMNYYNNGICNNSIEQAAMDECLAVVIPIYSGAEADITGGALYFHSFPNPSDWAYHNSYTQVYVSGTEKFWFYKE